jgi:hypothetical protein
MAGAAAKITETNEQTIASGGLVADVKPIAQPPSLAVSSRAVHGSAVRRGQRLPEAIKVHQLNPAALSQCPVAIFTARLLHLAGDDPRRDYRKSTLVSLKALTALVFTAILAEKRNNKPTQYPAHGPVSGWGYSVKTWNAYPTR